MSLDESLLLVELLEHTRRFVQHVNLDGNMITVDNIKLYAYLRDHLRRMNEKLGLLRQNSKSRFTGNYCVKLRIDSPLWAIAQTINRSRQDLYELAKKTYRDIIIARLYAYDIIDDGQYRNEGKEEEEEEEEIVTKLNEVDSCQSSSLTQPPLLDFAMRRTNRTNDVVTSCSLFVRDNDKYAKIVERAIVDAVRHGVDLSARFHLAIRATESLREEVRQLTKQVDREFSIVDQDSSFVAEDDLVRTQSLKLNEHIVSIVANNGSDHCGNRRSDNVDDDDDGGNGETIDIGDICYNSKKAAAATSQLLKYGEESSSMDTTRLRAAELDTQQRGVLLVSRERAIMDERVRCLSKTVEILRNALNGTSDSILLAVQQATREMESRLEQQEEERQAKHMIRMARLHEQIASLKQERTTLHSLSDSVDTVVRIGESARQSIHDTVMELSKASRELKAKNDFRERAMLNVEHRVLSLVRSYAHRIYGTSVLEPNILDYIHKTPYPRIINYDELSDIHVQFCLKHCSQLLALAKRSRFIASSPIVNSANTDKEIINASSSLFPIRHTAITAKSVHLCRDRLVAFLFFYGNIDTIDALRRLIARHEQDLQRRVASSSSSSSSSSSFTQRRESSRNENWSIFEKPLAMRALFGPQLVNRTLVYRLFLEEDWSDLAYVPISVLRYICDAFELRWRLLHINYKKPTNVYPQS